MTLSCMLTYRGEDYNQTTGTNTQYLHEKSETKSLQSTESDIKPCDSAEVESVCTDVGKM